MSEYTGPSLPGGFSFQAGELITGPPTIFPGEEELFQLLELGIEYGGYWTALVSAIILVILELIDELVLLFTGKPRAQDTLTVAKRLANGKSPLAHLMATQIHRNLNQNNIVLSSSDPADQKILGAIRKQAEASLVMLGASQARATQVVDNVWTNTTSATEKLPVDSIRSSRKASCSSARSRSSSTIRRTTTRASSRGSTLSRPRATRLTGF